LDLIVLALTTKSSAHASPSDSELSFVSEIQIFMPRTAMQMQKYERSETFALANSPCRHALTEMFRREIILSASVKEQANRVLRWQM
jgi:hypothetical protein